MYTAIKFQAYPTDRQKNRIEQAFGACRFVYNWGLRCKAEAFNNDKRMTVNDLLGKLDKCLIPENPWLAKINGDALKQSIFILRAAFKNYCRDDMQYPKYKTRNTEQSFRLKACYEVKDNCLHVDGIGDLVLDHRFQKSTVPHDIRFITVKKTVTCKYFVSFNVVTNENYPLTAQIDPSTTIGIDLGAHSLAVCSDGRKYDNKRFFMSNPKLRKMHECLAGMEEGSHNYQKQLHKINLLKEKIRNRRNAYYEDIATELTHDKNIQTICMESLDIRQMLGDTGMKQNLLDASMFTFQKILQRKCRKNGVNFITIDRYDPSSQTCNCCGHRNRKLKLTDRVWTCPNCGARLDRDLNAACNIRDMGLREMNVC